MRILVSSEIVDLFKNILSNWNFWSAIIATIAIILMGWTLTVKNILKQEWKTGIIQLVLIVALPALALKGFLVDTTLEQVKQQLIILLFGFLLHLVLISIANLIYIKYKKDIRNLLAMCTIFGSTTFFGFPIILAIWGKSEGIISANMLNVSYRVFIYSYAFMIMTDLKLDRSNLVMSMKKAFLNPILLATFIGLIIWITQLIPGIKIVNMNNKIFSPLRIDLLFQPFAKILDILLAIATPLSWIAIGMTLATGNIKMAIKDKKVWFYIVIKTIVIPLITLVMLIGLAALGNRTGNWKITETHLGVAVILMATPPASVVVTYALSNNKEPQLASNISLVATIAAIVMMPIWIIIVKVIAKLAIFG